MPEAASFAPPLFFFFFFPVSCLFSFPSTPLIQSSLNLLFLSTGVGTGQGQENDNIRSFSGQIRRAANGAQTGARAHTYRDDGWKVRRQGCKHDSWLFCGY